jgi:hypothetical protein
MKNVVLLFTATLFCFSCTQNKSQAPAGPSEIEYRLESSTTTFAETVDYTNETGGTNSLDSVPLPFSIKIQRPASAGVTLLLAHLRKENGRQLSLTGTMLVNGKVVKNQTGNGEQPIVNLSHMHQ